MGMSALRWFPANNPRPVAGVALAIHGLNYRPERMLPLVDCFTAAGVDCLSLSLHGHGDNYLAQSGLDVDAARLESFRRVTYELWRDETAAAYAIARARADELGVPLLLTGFSLGALMSCTLAATRPDVRFERMVLFAPALALRPWSGLPRLLRRRPRTMIPSAAPHTYRANRGTSSAAYNALFAALADLQRGEFQRLNVPALVLADRADELVSYAGLARLAAQLPAWTLCPVRKTGRAGREHHHLVIGAPAVGEAAWKDSTARITAFLGAPCGREEGPA